MLDERDLAAWRRVRKMAEDAFEHLPEDERIKLQERIAEYEAAFQIPQEERIDLLAKIAEYEHALEHTADVQTHEKYNQPYCSDCARLAQSALDGVNREGFKEMVTDDFED